MTDFKVKPPHVDPDHLLALLFAAAMLLFPDVARVVNDNPEAFAALLAGVGGRYGVRMAGVVAAGMAARNAVDPAKLTPASSVTVDHPTDEEIAAMVAAQ